MTNVPPRRLGRGLSGLLQSTVAPHPVEAPPTPDELQTAGSIPLVDVRPNPYQPRTAFDESALKELESSIQAHGVLQPIVVRRAAGGFEIVAGERRVRAARACGLDRIPAIVREVDDVGMQTLALVENLQRQDLNAIEKARALKAMMGAQGLTQEQVADRVGKDRATIANFLRLLDLPDEVRGWVAEGKLSAGHAKAVLQVSGDARRTQLARLVVERDLSVRDAERYARLSGKPAGARGAGAGKDPFLADIEQRLRRSLGLRVALRAKGRGGVVEIPYADSRELDTLLDRLEGDSK
jgi:ParB family chromosome partitioning protein